ncbi:MAG: hypothetical protein ACE15D_18730 [Candidatus Eisenbacteria bacterium]
MAKTADEAVINYTVNQYSAYLPFFSGPVTITPAPGKKIVCQSFVLYHDVVGLVVEWSSPGVDTVRMRGPVASVQYQAFPFFAAEPDQPVTVAKTAGAGSYAFVEFFWIEV